ncbi:hypothetical protein B0H17DRAFT_1199101 [Mycena rosella]|uniref:BTB domain-containing protein n=1 Tax=Mycena rosella TaxID=1033263 RepID=A0AAD7DLK8_MYCRO|nr:hypothetical protein B0H17DRAFT_1199101 [Mycena rosella]
MTVVILKAGTRLFRVFTSILKNKSPVFADMFAMSQPDSADVESIDGVPVVLMHDDPTELEFFLKAIFDSNYFMPPPALSDINVIVAVLRLATKYEDYRSGSEQTFPTDPSIYVTLKMIQVAVEVGALWLLPNAYHDLHRETLQTVLATGTLWDQLGDAEKDNCLRVFSHEARIRSAIELLVFLAGSWSPDNVTTLCNTPAFCNLARLMSLEEYDWSTSHDALDLFTPNGCTNL